jgi:hypothetical protein
MTAEAGNSLGTGVSMMNGSSVHGQVAGSNLGKRLRRTLERNALGRSTVKVNVESRTHTRVEVHAAIGLLANVLVDLDLGKRFTRTLPSIEKDIDAGVGISGIVSVMVASDNVCNSS